MERRLATVLAADIVGYSSLMADDEDATVRTLMSHREVVDRVIGRHDGRIFNTGGDSVLAEFGSAVEAVRCAITIQDELRVRNSELVPDRRLRFRIGINVGDVLVNGNDLLGDGVNIAARLEGIAQPGGICISGSTFEQVKSKLSVGFEDLGPQRVKNIPEPIAAFSVTSAPVTVAAKGTVKAGRTAAGSTSKLSWRSPIAIAAAVLLIISVAGVVFWRSWERGPMPLSAFPENISTENMRAKDIEALMAGITISGQRRSDNQPFEIVLNADKTASYTFSGSGKLSGETLREIGRWWVEDYRFCMQLPKFAMGQKACPRIIKSGQTLEAVRPVNGVTLPWTLKK